MHHILFISDIHLQQSRINISHCFLKFLTTQAPKADAVYILGDLFEVWIGDDNNTAFYQTILSAIQTLSTTTPVYFMRGNRDFLVGKRFAKATGCVILDDPSVVELYGKRVLLSHGDVLCTTDGKHQTFRRLTQNPNYNRFFLWLPLCIRQSIATIIRGKSQKHLKNIDYIMMDVTQNAVIEMMQTYHTDLLIHGHTHQPNIHRFMIGNQPATRVTLGDWHKQGSVLIYNQDGDVELQSIPIT